MTRYAVKMRLANGEWEHGEFCDGQPVFHETAEAAEKVLADHLLSLEGAVEDGYIEDFDPTAWRVEPVA